MKYDLMIDKLNTIHNYKYTYGKLEIINDRTYIEVFCKNHGKFKQRLDAHLRGQVCKKCSIEDRMQSKFIDYDKIIDECNKKHNSKYKYPLGQIFKKTTSKIDIICEKHGLFTQTIHNHLVNGTSCPKCSNEHRNNHLKNKDESIRNVLIDIYRNNKNIEIVDTEYINNLSDIRMRCKIHGIFSLKYGRAIRGQGCKFCNEENRLQVEKEKFINISNKIWKGIFDYSKVEYKGLNIKVIIQYNGKEYLQTPYNHMRLYSPFKNRSNGEIIIESVLNNHNIEYIREKTFDGLRHIKKLRFDFYLPLYNTCIEFDGIQHFEPVNKWGGVDRLSSYLKLDSIKNNYCRDNNINIIRISYKDIKNIEKIIIDYVKQHTK